jgi:phosphatidylglycerol---prolipoprotein diacylglyceryl transferase
MIDGILSFFYFPRLDPVIFQVGPFAVRWYGLAYVVGFVLAYFLLQRLARTGQFRVKQELVGDLVFWMAVAVFVGGRLGWWIFYHRPVPGRDELWWEPFAVWRGGMSFHGSLTAVVLGMIAWSWVRRVSFLNLADCAALVTPIGLFFGRIANFINAELRGRPTTVPWGVVFPREDVPPGVWEYEPFARHPSQLYEAFFEGLVLLAILWLVWRYWRPRDGRTGALFLIGYGLFRFLVEFTRQPDAQLGDAGYIAFGWLTMGQLLSLLMLTGGVLCFIFFRPWPQPQPEPQPEGDRKRKKGREKD